MLVDILKDKLPCSRCDNVSGNIKVLDYPDYLIIKFICDNCGKVLYEEKILKNISL